MMGFMITTDYAEKYGVFDRRTVVVNMYSDLETVINKVTDEGQKIVTRCDADHPMVVCLHLSRWTSYKTIQRLYTALTLFKNKIKNEYEVNVIIDFTSITSETLVRFGALEDFQSLSGHSIDVRDYPTE
jgi:hypothetical protein